jgi:ankyrin repeat protein
MQLPALAEAAKKGDLRKVKELISSGHDINDAGKRGSPLILAAQGGHMDVLKTLVEAGADPNITSAMGATALNKAAELGNIPMLNYLLENGSQVGPLALIMAAREGFLKVVRILVDAGADLNATQHWGQTALMLAAKNGHAAIVKYLLEKGADATLQQVV